MPLDLESVYESEDQIPETVRSIGLYEERGGKFYFTKVKGMATQADVERVQRALSQEREAHKGVKLTLDALLGGATADEVRAKLDLIPELEAKAAGGKFDDKKVEDLVNARLASKLAPIEREKQQATQKLTEYEKLVAELQGERDTRKIHDAVRAVSKGGKDGKGFKVADTAEEDVLMYAERHLAVVDGNVQTREGIPGIAPGLDAQTWLSELAPRKPHWFPPSGGGGAQGGGRGGYSGVDNPWSEKGWNITKQMAMFKENAETARNMARAAGSFIGATAPTKR